MFSLPEHRNTETDGAVYAELAQQLRGLLEGERDGLANAANFSALLFHAVPNLNWAGFYFLRGQELVLGPFQGKPACVRIALGKGVCGTAARERRALVVDDVHAFPGHIACDPASRSELVVPLVAQDRLIGVWDVDSPLLHRFGERDQVGMETLVAMLAQASDW